MAKRKPKRREIDREKGKGEQSRGAPQYPAVSIAQYGPDDKTTTKIAASVVLGPTGPMGELKRWVASDVATSLAVRQELWEFIHKHKAQTIIMTTGVIGCIHEEGKDYPQGQECPFCPFWHGRDRWAKANPVIMTLGQFRKRHGSAD
jgi:hypothetical protein